MFSRNSTSDYSSIFGNRKAKVITLDEILTWRQQTSNHLQDTNTSAKDQSKLVSGDVGEIDLASRVSYFEGDITTLKVGAIVNAANNTLLGGGGVDGCIHRAAGENLLNECRSLKGCQTGDAKITKGYNLPSQFVIHTVGPTDQHPGKLESCYRKCFELVKTHHIKSVAFPCIATGIYGFPNSQAAEIALGVTKEFLQVDNNLERVIFCLFTEVDKKVYKNRLPDYFP